MAKRVFIALDFPTGDEAINFLLDYELKNVPVKVGMQLFYREGPAIIERLKTNGHSIFLDLKLHDIPNTVKESMKQLALLDVDIVNVHAAGGKKMIAAAREGLEKGGNTHRPLLFAVTQLTSTNETMLKNDLLINENLENVVRIYAKNSIESGADGVVCSVHEVKKIKKEIGERCLTITPGIRLINDQLDDQVRVATVNEAKLVKTDFIVVGRTVTKSMNPKETYDQIIREWQC